MNKHQKHKIVKYGKSVTGKQKFYCKSCKCFFHEEADKN